MAHLPMAPFMVLHGTCMALHGACTFTTAPDWPMQDGRYVLNWPDLAIPDYRTEFNEEIQQEVSIPLFRDEVKRLHGQLVLIEGFFIPFEAISQFSVLFLRRRRS